MSTSRRPDPEDSPLVNFYRAESPDSYGRQLVEILQQDDDWLENCHNYIQWLFPNREPSGVTPNAPTLTPEIEALFHSDPQLQRHLMLSLERMLGFYGLKITADGIDKAANWHHRKLNWFVRDTHNNLRITRILKCLWALGLESEAIELQRRLLQLCAREPDCGIGTRTRDFWRRAFDN